MPDVPPTGKSHARTIHNDGRSNVQEDGRRQKRAPRASPAARNALVAAAQQDLSRWFTEGKLKATVAATYDLADWVKAFRLIEERTVVGKAVLVP